MIIKLIGSIVRVLDKKSGISKSTGNEWVSQDYVIEEINPNVQNPSRICFTVFGQDAINFYNFHLGQNVSVDCTLSSTEYNGRFYTSLNALKPAVTAQTQQYQQPQYQNQYQPQPQPQPQQQYQQRPQQTPQYQPQQDVNADSLPF